MTAIKWWPRPAGYADVWQAMRDFTEARDTSSPDEIWLVEHAPVYTLGQAGKPQHILDSGAIPIVHSDRGGQVTYHGPGQVLAYCLIDLRRHRLYAKEYVALLEDVVIQVLDELGASGACRKPGAPGVYVPAALTAAADARAALVPAADAAAAHPDELCKIAALGIKIRNGCAYHGLSLNVDMDLSPFSGINPCGYEGLQTVDLRRCGIVQTVEAVGELMAVRLQQALAKRISP